MSDIAGLLDKYKQIEGERFFNDVFIKEEYLPAKDVKADIVVDIGACAGEFSAWIYDNAKVIYAIEPEVGHFQELLDNVREFELDKIKPYKLAISGENGEGWLDTHAGRGGHHFESDGDELVQTKTLATFMKDEGIDHIDLLKVDVENAETEIFTSRDFEDIAPKINFIIGEHLSPIDPILQKFGFKPKGNHDTNIYYTR